MERSNAFIKKHGMNGVYGLLNRSYPLTSVRRNVRIKLVIYMSFEKNVLLRAGKICLFSFVMTRSRLLKNMQSLLKRLGMSTV